MMKTAVVLVLGLVACSDATPESDSNGIPELGITNVVVSDTTQESTVIGYDEAGAVVAQMSLIHGRFALTGPFVSEYDTPEVDGRKLDVDVHGQTLLWETEGYTPTLQMPAHPASAHDLAMFLEAPQVKDILTRWQIGFEAGGADEETAYASGSYSGTSITNCDGLTSCGSVRGLTINTCGGGGAAIKAGKGTMSNPALAGTNQDKVAQCCPAGTGGSANAWFATKTCPWSGTTSECGTSTGACKGCAVYDTPFGCSVTRDASHVYYSYTDSVVLTANVGVTGTSGSLTATGSPDGFLTASGSNVTKTGLFRTTASVSVTASCSTSYTFISGACSAQNTNHMSASCSFGMGGSAKSITVACEGP